MIDRPKKSRGTLILAHGAGAPMDSPWMDALTERLVAEGITVVRFEFPYMAARRGKGGKKKPPDRLPILQEAWLEAVAAHKGKVFVGGKSMGGRIATTVEWPARVRGMIGFGYPFHAPGRPPGERLEPLRKLARPLLICQGEKDAMGSRSEVKRYKIDPKIRWTWLEGGNHDLKPAKATGLTLEDHLDAAAEATAAFIAKVK